MTTVDYPKEVVDCQCICHFYPEQYECSCCEWANEKWIKLLN